MKNKTKKCINLEKNRYSILTNSLEKCYLCPNKKDDIHEIYAGSKRIISIKNGFCIPICRKCHSEIQSNEEKMLKLKIECQKKYEESHSREEFMKMVGKNYL